MIAATLFIANSAYAQPTINPITPVKVQIGAITNVSGSTTPPVPNEQIRLEQNQDNKWVQIGKLIPTSNDGSWLEPIRFSRSGSIRAVQISDNTMSPEVSVLVAPKVLNRILRKGEILPFLGTRATWRVAPHDYQGTVKIQLTVNKKDAGWVKASAKNGIVSAAIPTNGVGSFRVKLMLPSTDKFAAANDNALTFAVKGSSVSEGSSAKWVRSLRAGLNFRGIYTPRSGGFTSHMGDAVIAFHKAYKRPRTTSFELSDWNLLTFFAIKPRYQTPDTHIEVDKARQILMQVKNGKASMVIHISSGKTGNTPSGKHRVGWKGNWVPSLYETMLYKSMSFQGTYAIHGYPSVPTTAASHGCVRVPMWIAATLYSRTPVGTTVYVYEGPGSTQASVGRDKYSN